MTTPKMAQRSPYEFQVAEGQKYAWCACGLSATQPLCDGSHKTTDLKPVIFKAGKSGTVWLCGCKNTRGKPFCDGTHSTL